MLFRSDTIYKNSIEFLLIAGLGSGFENNNIQERFKKIQEEIDTMENTSFYNILLLHEPDFIDKINIDEFNMILAGHSHDGQIKIPFIGSVVRPKYADIYYESEYKINNTNLYISNGLGTSILPLRYFNRPSFNVYRLNTK